MTSLGGAMAEKIRQMNEKIIPAYEVMLQNDPNSKMIIAIMREKVRRATESLASDDVIEMLLSWAEIKDYKE